MSERRGAGSDADPCRLVNPASRAGATTLVEVARAAQAHAEMQAILASTSDVNVVVGPDQGITGTERALVDADIEFGAESGVRLIATGEVIDAVARFPGNGVVTRDNLDEYEPQWEG